MSLPGNSDVEKKLQVFDSLVNTLLQWLLVYMSSASGGFASALEPRWGTSVPSPPVLSPIRNKFMATPLVPTINDGITMTFVAMFSGFSDSYRTWYSRCAYAHTTLPCSSSRLLVTK